MPMYSPLYLFTSFKYPGIVIAAEYNNCPGLVRNLRRARQKLEPLTRVLSREGADACTLVHIYFLVLQLVLMYSSETWFLTICMKRLLGGFQHMLDHSLTGRQPWKGRDGVWFYPPLEDAMAEAGLQEVETYISLLQNTVAKYI